MKEKSPIMYSLILAGSYTAYNIGSGLASGTEALQFLVSFGGYWPFIMIAFCTIFTIITVFIMYSCSYSQNFKEANEGYYYFGGKYIGKAYDALVVVTLVSCGLVMISGSGATINQLLGVPVYVGSVFMGIISAFAACKGLRKLVNILGYMGIVIVISVISISIYTISTTNGSPVETSKNVLQYVAEGKILQTGYLGIYHPIVAGVTYAGTLLLVSAPWVLTTGRLFRSNKDIMWTSVFSASFFYVCVLAVVIILMLKMDVVAGTQVPMLAAVQDILPILAYPYTAIIITAIFTTVTGMMWVLADRFANEGEKKFNIIIIGTIIFGVVGGSIFPFTTIVNFVYTLIGIAGILFGILIIIKAIKIKVSGNSLLNK